MLSNQLLPMKVERNEIGCWVHPVLLEYLGENIQEERISREEWKAFEQHFDIQTVTMYLDETYGDLYDDVMDSTDLNKWQPIYPDGFFLIDINFYEEGAYAIFARPNRETEVA